MKNINEYHQRTMHSPVRFADGPSYLDWEAQPAPFRRFEGAKRIRFPRDLVEPGAPYDALFGQAAAERRPLNPDNLSMFLRLSLGLAAWKQYGASRWALRVNPSSGNLHAEEGYVIIGQTGGLEEGVYHYCPQSHALELRCRLHPGLFEQYLDGSRIFLVALSSIHWREEWKYGERAYRYCQLDIGHALMCLRFAAAAMGWKARLAPAVSSFQIIQALGLDRHSDFAGAERETPGPLLVLSTGEETIVELHGLSPRLTDFLSHAATGGEWAGVANAASEYHTHNWPVVEQAARLTDKPETFESFAPPPAAGALPLSGYPHTAAHIIITRRSGQAYDGKTTLASAQFFRIMAALIPRNGAPPWDMIPWPAMVHPILFVHRVAGLAPGMYALVRRPGEEVVLKDAMEGDWAWSRPAPIPEDLPLYLLKEMDTQDSAAAIACRQDIAGDGAFSLGMLARYADNLRMGEWWYRRLHWEAGAMGQTLYLELEAAGFQGTGIGCYFDGLFHSMLGLRGEVYQCLYQFTAGMALVDRRITTLPPYAPGVGEEA